MTREEAKAYIIQHCIPNYPKMDKTEWDAAMGKAIEALRQPDPRSFSCGQENDMVSRQAAIDALHMHLMYRMGTDSNKKRLDDWINGLPSAQETHEERTETHACDLIDRQAAIDAVDVLCQEHRYRIPGKRETYSQYNEAWQDALDRAEVAIGNLPSVRPATSCSEIPNGSDDTISRQVAIDALARMMPRSYTPDGSHPGDEEIFRAQEVIADCIEALEILPSAAPSTAHTTETTAETTAPSTDGWVSVKNRLPAVRCCRCLITRDDGRGRATVEEALFSFGRWYSNEWLEDGRHRKFDISASVIAWAPFPAPYRGGDSE